MKKQAKAVKRAKSTKKTVGTAKKSPAAPSKAKRVPVKKREKSPTPQKKAREKHGGARRGSGRKKTGPSSPSLPAELAQQIREAKDEGADALIAALGEAAALSVEGKLDRPSGKMALEFSKEIRQGLKVRALEPRPSEIATATEILTADEWEVVERARAARRTLPLKPGDAPPPPPEEPAP